MRTSVNLTFHVALIGGLMAAGALASSIAFARHPDAGLWGENPLKYAKVFQCKGLLSLSDAKKSSAKEVTFEVRPRADCSGGRERVLQGHEIWVEGKYEPKANINRAYYCTSDCEDNSEVEMDLDGTQYLDHVVDTSKHRKIVITDCAGRGPLGFKGRVPNNVSGNADNGATFHWSQTEDMPCFKTEWQPAE